VALDGRAGGAAEFIAWNLIIVSRADGFEGF
jgi:hypothetical protein